MVHALRTTSQNAGPPVFCCFSTTRTPKYVLENCVYGHAVYETPHPVWYLHHVLLGLSWDNNARSVTNM